MQDKLKNSFSRFTHGNPRKPTNCCNSQLNWLRLSGHVCWMELGSLQREAVESQLFNSLAIHPVALQLSRCSSCPTPSQTVEEACETSQASRLRSYIKDVTAIMNEWLVPEKTHTVPSFLVGEVHNGHTRQSNWTFGVKHGSDSKVWPLKITYYIHTSSISLF